MTRDNANLFAYISDETHLKAPNNNNLHHYFKNFHFFLGYFSETCYLCAAKRKNRGIDFVFTPQIRESKRAFFPLIKSGH